MSRIDVEKSMQNKIKNWDSVTKLILIISILIIIFSFISPFIFTLPSSLDKFDFTETGPIGDTIGGILNPFIALAGVLLTFLAFYMQIKANQIQVSQFEQGLRKEKQIKIHEEKQDCLNKLNLLKTDLDTIMYDIRKKAKLIKEYYENEKENPFKTNYLHKTPSKKYTRVLEIDRLSIFKGFSFFFTNRTNWIKEFSSLYHLLDLIPEFFELIYSNHESHLKDLFELKNWVRDALIKLENMLADIMQESKINHQNYLNNLEYKLAKDTLARYYNVLDESVGETDLMKINKEMLLPFLDEAYHQRNNRTDYNPKLNTIMGFIGNIRKQISLIEKRSEEFSDFVKKEYENLMVDKSDRKSYNTQLVEIYEILETELENISLEN